LVDTGAALRDVEDPNARFSRAFIATSGVRLKKKRCAVEQIKARGLDPLDVKDIVLTHLDLDHAAGLVDFPNATVHVTSAELAAAKARATLVEKLRYVEAMWAHDPKWKTHDGSSGDAWNGFEAVRPIDDEEEVLMIPLRGHTRGHAAVAVRSPIPNGREWLLHAGDSYFFHDEIHATPPRCPTGLSFYQTFLAPDEDARKQNQDRLRRLAADKSTKTHVFCAHSASEFDELERTANNV
ncbi:MAG: MBL fold metallo-hydrolase, partial [Polyangiaceae bacterium]